MKPALTVNAARFWFNAATPRAPFLRAAALVVIAAMLAAPAAVIAGALWGEGGALSAAAAADYALQTALYAGCTVAFALAIALPAAWLTVMRRFPGAGLVSWALFLPLALPPYITGYALSGFAETAAGIQPGGIIPAASATALAVYPYIYLFARGALQRQSCHIQSAARLMGYSPLAACGKISWPLARPAVAAGAALALMETLNDFAVAEHYGVRALGLGVYDLWLNRGDIYAACRLAVLLMFVVFGLMVMEERGRKKQRHYAAQCDRCFACDRAAPMSRTGGALCAAALLLPAAGGFFLPVLWFANLAWKTPPDLWRTPFWEGLGGSLMLSLTVAAVLFILAGIFAADKRRNGHGALFAPPAKLAQTGYALPGAVLAQGFFLLAAWSGGAVIAFGGIALVIAACAARFFIIAVNALESGMTKIPPQLEAAARLANKSASGILWHVHLPLLRPALAAGALLAFLEGIKELPMTLILRPFDFNTLATVIYQYASDESPELAAPAVLAMAALGAFAVSSLFILEGKTRGAEGIRARR
ncbi:MAG: ABC transporter permease [Gammaproteobacteria bacterium]